MPKKRKDNNTPINQRMESRPLADFVRPDTLDGFAGQGHIIGQDKLLRKAIESGNISNMIFYGPSGTGKTTLAYIIAKMSDLEFYKINATNSSLADVRNVIEQSKNLIGGGRVLLYLDEIQNFNKKQQQSLLEFIETGEIVLIASTTENPYFYVYNAILSRSTVYEFLPLGEEDITQLIERSAGILSDKIGAKVGIEEDALLHMARLSNGDARRALNALELAVYNTAPDDSGVNITLQKAEEASQKKAFSYDRDGDNHYDALSCLQKSIRGSDPDAAIHYLARLCAAGDLASICRRILVMAAEDVGLAYPMAITITKSCVDSALQLGFPEARIPLAEAAILLATAPKSNSAYMAINDALADLEKRDPGEIPLYLRDSNYSGAKKLGRGIGYQYPHDFPNHWVEQEYMPSGIRGTKYYVPQENKFEESLKKYWEEIKK